MSPETIPTIPPTRPAFTSWTPPWGVPPERAGELAAWLDNCERELVHPAEVDDRLRRLGWHPATAAAATTQYRKRFNEHALGYSGLLFATGFAALGAGTAGHLLAAGIDAPVNRDALAVWITVLVCALPFALWSHAWARRADCDDPVAVWSAPLGVWAHGFLHRFDRKDPSAPAPHHRPE